MLNECKKITFSMSGKIIPKPDFTGPSERLYSEEDFINYEESIGQLATEAMNKQNQNLFAQDVYVLTEVIVGIPPNWTKEIKEKALQTKLKPITNKKELDQIMENIVDAMTEIVYHHPRQIGDGFIYKRYGEETKTKVTVWGII